MLGEGLAALELRGLRRRAEAGDPGVPDGVGGAGDQRHLGPDDDEVRRQATASAAIASGSATSTGERLGDGAGAGVAGGAGERAHRGVGGERHAQGVLPGTGTDHDHAHGAKLPSGAQRSRLGCSRIARWKERSRAFSAARARASTRSSCRCASACSLRQAM